MCVVFMNVCLPDFAVPSVLNSLIYYNVSLNCLKQKVQQSQVDKHTAELANTAITKYKQFKVVNYKT